MRRSNTRRQNPVVVIDAFRILACAAKAARVTQIYLSATAYIYLVSVGHYYQDNEL